MKRNPRLLAQAAGILYLVTHVTSVGAVVAYRSGLVVAGVTLEFVLAIGCVGTGTVLWTLLRQHGSTRAATFALLRGVEASVIIAGALPMLAAIHMDGEWLQAASAVHAAAFLLGQGLVISVNTIVLGWLLLGSRTVPRGLAVLGIVGGALVLVSNLAQLWGVIPVGGAMAGAAAAPVFGFELWFAIYLLTRGLRSTDTSNQR